MKKKHLTKALNIWFTRIWPSLKHHCGGVNACCALSRYGAPLWPAPMTPRRALGLSLLHTVGVKTGRGIVLHCSLSSGHTRTNTSAVEKSCHAGTPSSKRSPKCTGRHREGRRHPTAGCSESDGASNRLIPDQLVNWA